MNPPSNSDFLGALVRGFGKNLMKLDGNILDAATATACDMAGGVAAASEGEDHFAEAQDATAAQILNTQGEEVP